MSAVSTSMPTPRVIPARIVEVRAGRHHQAEPSRRVPESAPPAGSVAGIEHLEPGQPGVGQLADDLVVIEPARMCQHRHAAAAAHDRDRFERRDVVRGRVAGAAAREQVAKRGGDVAHHPGADQGFGDVRPAQGVAAAGFGQHLLDASPDSRPRLSPATITSIRRAAMFAIAASVSPSGESPTGIR